MASSRRILGSSDSYKWDSIYIIEKSKVFFGRDMIKTKRELHCELKWIFKNMCVKSTVIFFPFKKNILSNHFHFSTRQPLYNGILKGRHCIVMGPGLGPELNF